MQTLPPLPTTRARVTTTPGGWGWIRAASAVVDKNAWGGRKEDEPEA